MLKILRFAALFFVLFTFSNAHSQNQTIDSLKVLLQNPKIHDTTRLSIMSEIIGNSKVGDTAIGHYNKLIKQILDKKLAQKNLSKKEKNAYLYSLAFWYCDKSSELYSKKNAALIISYYDRAIAIFKELKMDEETWYTINNKGYALRKLGLYNQAIDCFFAALKHHEERGNKQGVAYSQTAIATVYDDMYQYSKMLSYNLKAYQYYGSIKKPSDQDLYETAILLNNIGSAYLNLKQYENAKTYLYKSVKVSQQIQNNEGIGFSMKVLGDVEATQHHDEEALKKYKEGLLFAKKDRTRLNLLIALGKGYLKANNIPEAKKHLLEALPYAQSINEFSFLGRIYKNLHLVYKAENNFKASLEMSEKYNAIVDSTKIQSSRDALLQQQLKYDYEKKELNYKLAAATKNNLLILLSAALILILLGGYFYYRNNKQKQSISVLEKNQIKQKLLITQMNPHFIFNSIENIRSLIYENQNDDAVNYLGKFSRLTRQILENSNQNYISLTEEVEMIENYLAIQQLLYSNKFDYKITIEDTIDTETIFLPPMLTQPFIENAIKHGLSNRAKNGMIDIHFYLNESKLFFEVADNGKGFAAAKNNASHKSLAMTITKERLVSYTKNQDYVMQTDNIIDQDHNVIGAKVVFEIPYIYEN